MANIERIKDYAGYLVGVMTSINTRLNAAREDYATMLEEGAFMVDADMVLDGLEDSLNNIGKEIYSIMKMVSVFVDGLPKDEEKEGEKHGEV